MTQPDTKNDRELAEHAVCAKLLRTVAQGDQFLQGGADFGSYFWSGGTAFGGGPDFA